MSVGIKGSGKSISLAEARDLVSSGKARVSEASPAQIRMLTDEDAPPRVPQEGAYAGSRKRKGSNWPAPFGPWLHPSMGKDNMVPASTLRSVYRKSSAVGAAIDFISRTISTTPWRVVSDPGVRKRDFDHAVDILTRPGAAGSKASTFRKFLALILNDLLVLDKVIVEKVRATGGSLIYLEPRDAATFKIDEDEQGGIEGYKQLVKDRNNKTGTREIPFDLDDILYMVMYPRTDSVHGTPRIEKVISEISALMLGIDAIASFFSEDEIPSGLLHLGEVGEEIAKRAQEDFQSRAGLRSKRELTVIGGKGEPRWVQFRRPFKEMEISSIMPRIERMVYRVFGVTPLEMAQASDVNRSTAESFERIRAFNLIKPMLDLLAEEITFNVLHEIDDRIFLEFVHFARVGVTDSGEDFTGTDTSDIPGSGEGEDLDTAGKVVSTSKPGRSTPTFGFDEKMARGFKPMFISSPSLVPYEPTSSRIFMPRISTEEAVSYLDDQRLERREKIISRIKTIISVFLDEGLEDVESLGSLSGSSLVRGQLEETRDEICNQIELCLLEAERVTKDYLEETGLETLSDKSFVPSLVKETKTRINELIDGIVEAESIEEEIAMIRGLEYDFMNVSKLVDEALSLPICQSIGRVG